MDLATILTGGAFRVSLKKNDSDADIMMIDVTMSETTNLEAEVTDHPVEDGPDINDHIRPKPATIDLEGIISETPLTLVQDAKSLTTDRTAALKSIARGFGGGATSQLASKLTRQYGSIASGAAGFAGASLFQNDTNPAKAARLMLEKLLVEKTIFTLNLKHKSYKNMAITKLVFPRTNDVGKALKFSMSCKQINVVKSATVAAIARTAAGGAQKKANLGKQPPKEAAAPVYKSLAKRAALGIGDAIGGLFSSGGGQ